MKEKVPLVICDTNIWYAVGEGKIQQQSLKDINLVGTFISAYEMSHSPAIYKKTEIWKRSVDAFLHLPVRHKYYSPPRHLLFLSGMQPPNTDELKLFSDLQALRNGIDKIDPSDLVARIQEIKATLK